MKLRLKSSSAARSLIREYEPFHAVAERDADGRWTVGYGHRAGAREDTTVSRDDADLLLIYDVLQAERAIDETITEDLQTPQRDALVAFALGIGLTAFRRSAVVRLINKGRWSAAADAIAAWGGGEIGRHLAERDLFRTDLPADTSSTPVELVIEVEHPDLDDETPVTEVDAETEGDASDPDPVGIEPSASDDTDDAPADDPESSEAPEAPAETEIADEPADEVAVPAPQAVASRPLRSAVAERVIARMRSQLAIREPEPVEDVQAATRDDDTEADLPDDTAMNGPVGYVFAEAAEAELDDDILVPEAEETPGPLRSEPPETVELPDQPIDALPVVAGAAATGEVGHANGLSRAGNPSDGDVEIETADEDEGLPVPEDISPEFEAGAFVPRRNGWANGDDSPAPQAASFPTGTVSVLGIGILAFGVGVWDTASRWDAYYTGDVWPFGPATAAAGFVLTAAASIALIGRTMRKS
jgi:GH24 family phage-related lysozyme (muramidase)